MKPGMNMDVESAAQLDATQGGRPAPKPGAHDAPRPGAKEAPSVHTKRAPKKVGIVMGSTSDLPVVGKAAAVLDELGIPYEMHVYSAHRTPAQAAAFAAGARENGFGAIIAAAGMAAHLAGALAAQTTLPVIGIPIAASLQGIDALLATVQMPSGIPVATVAVDGAKNAAFLAAQILAVEDAELAAKLAAARAESAEAVLAADAEIGARGGQAAPSSPGAETPEK